MQQEDKYCKHCWPTKRSNHISLHIEYYINKVTLLISNLLSRFNINNSKRFIIKSLSILFESLSLIKIVKFEDNPDHSRISNRSLIFFIEAKKRGLNIQALSCFGKYINEFRLIYNQKKYYYEGIPLVLIEKKSIQMDNKDLIKKILDKNHIPTAKGGLFTKKSKGLIYGKEIGFPLVVKPCDGSLSHHVTYPIHSETQLLQAINVAKEYTSAFIIEKYIKGNLFRASVINRDTIFICQKENANVLGDSNSSIEELINIKNNQKNRGETKQMNTTLHQIPINIDLISNLKKQGLDLQSIPKINEKIYLQKKFTLSNGCDIINVTDVVHKDNEELFLKIANILESDLVGIDFICPDITKSYKEQETTILETNSLPYIDMHQYPSHGDSIPVAEIVWDIVLAKIR